MILHPPELNQLASGRDAFRYICFPAARRVSRCMDGDDR